MHSTHTSYIDSDLSRRPDAGRVWESAVWIQARNGDAELAVWSSERVAERIGGGWSGEWDGEHQSGVPLAGVSVDVWVSPDGRGVRGKDGDGTGSASVEVEHIIARLGREKKEEKEKEEWEEMVRVSEAEHKRQIVHVGNHVRAFLRSLSDEGTDQNTKIEETTKEEQGKEKDQGNEGEARTLPLSNSPSPHSSMVGGSECNDRRFSGSVLFSDGLSRDEQMESLRRVGRTATVAQVSSTELEQTLLSMETESQRMMWSAEFVNPVFATNDFVPIGIEFVG
ncbi:hypothetical protein BLNAU_3263 [Blattamonas nauphoetae]|uniref:Uncharacterized protein n=1 Tax=Blattamonas nauphoetae TaxID=2049346 RepID=A0ABQ9YDI6_9EUKA|nr:hypothetical protein BLNAU_3263 [Blattamonas nauphoetae]